MQQQQAAGMQPRRSRAARRDPLEPKQNKTPFNFFSIDARTKAKSEHPSADQKVGVLSYGDLLSDLLWAAFCIVHKPLYTCFLASQGSVGHGGVSALVS